MASVVDLFAPRCFLSQASPLTGVEVILTDALSTMRYLRTKPIGKVSKTDNRTHFSS